MLKLFKRIVAISLIISCWNANSVPNAIVEAVNAINDDVQYKTLTDYISLQWRSGNYEELKEINKLVQQASHDLVALRDGYARNHYRELRLPKEPEAVLFCTIVPFLGLGIMLRERPSTTTIPLALASLLISVPVTVPVIFGILGMKDDFKYAQQGGQKRIEQLAHFHSMIETLLMMKAE